MGKLKALIRGFWEGMHPSHRVFVKIYAVVSTVILILALVLLFIFRSHPEEAPPMVAALQDVADLAATDSVATLLPEVPPEDLEAHRKLVALLGERQMWDEAIVHLERVADYFEADPDFHESAGRTYLSGGRPGPAVASLNRAIELDSTRTRLWPPLAEALWRNGSRDEGMQLLKRAVAIDSGSPEASTLMATLIAEQDSSDTTADQLFESVLSRHPDHREACYQYGRTLTRRGDYHSALIRLEKARAMDPLDFRVHAQIGIAEHHRGRWAQAEEAYRTALGLNPQDADTWYNLGEYYLGQSEGHWNRDSLLAEQRRAARCFLQTLALDKLNPGAHFKVGLLMNFNRQHKEAVQHLELALQADPEDSRVLTQLGVALEGIGRTGEAGEFYQRAWHIDPMNPLLSRKVRDIRKRLAEELVAPSTSAPAFEPAAAGSPAAGPSAAKPAETPEHPSATQPHNNETPTLPIERPTHPVETPAHPATEAHATHGSGHGA
jgi:Flp pilus assembly protein TadD